MTYTHHIADEMVVLLPQSALYWGRTGTLFVADLHLGKADTSRRSALHHAGVNSHADLARLMRLIEIYRVRRLVVLGDLLHAYGALSPGALASFAAWRAAHNDIEMILVRGNHDRATGDPPRDWHFTAVNPGHVLMPFVLHHEPPPASHHAYVLCGHLHPGVLLHTHSGRRAIKPCFWFRQGQLILPAFGSFTACAPVEPSEGDEVYMIADEAVVRFVGQGDQA
jgi:DNA ligase-associated metallophosphoesterase